VQNLVQGIHRFQADIFSSKQELFAHLARGQRPQALYITCSDSRINPNLITQTEPGELFIVRNVGNLVPAFGADGDAEAAAVEYAVEALCVDDIIVCGHTGCGAMQGLLNPEMLTAMPRVRDWLRHAEVTRRIIDREYPHLAGEERLTAAAEENVLHQIENLRTHPAVAAGLKAGRLKLHGWMYKIATGQMFAYEPERGQYVDLAQSGALSAASQRSTT
jgi:carbonic anhydrase